MKQVLLLLIAFFSYCANAQDLSLSIQVISVDPHPTLSDHSKKLLVFNQGEIITEQQLYLDPGSGCSSYLFEVDSAYILIECNGHWYTISKTNGGVENIGWFWQKDLPENLLGYYRYEGQEEYTFKSTKTINKEDVYKFKDPD